MHAPCARVLTGTDCKSVLARLLCVDSNRRILMRDLQQLDWLSHLTEDDLKYAAQLSRARIAAHAEQLKASQALAKHSTLPALPPLVSSSAATPASPSRSGARPRPRTLPLIAHQRHGRRPAASPPPTRTSRRPGPTGRTRSWTTMSDAVHVELLRAWRAHGVQASCRR